MNKHTSFASIDHDQLSRIIGGKKKDDPVSPETVGCAVGGAAGAQVAGPWGGAAGCILGGAVANQVSDAIKRDNAGQKPEQKPHNPYSGGSGSVYGNL